MGTYVFTAAQQSAYYWMSGMWNEGMDGIIGGNPQSSIQNPALLWG